MATSYRPNLVRAFILCTAVLASACDSSKTNSEAPKLPEFDGIALLEPQFTEAALKHQTALETSGNSAMLELNESQRRLEGTKRAIVLVDQEIEALRAEKAKAQAKAAQTYELELKKYDEVGDKIVTSAEIFNYLLRNKYKEQVTQQQTDLKGLKTEKAAIQKQIKNLNKIDLMMGRKRKLEIDLQIVDEKMKTVNASINDLTRQIFAEAAEEYKRIQSLQNAADTLNKQMIQAELRKKDLLTQIEKAKVRIKNQESKVASHRAQTQRADLEAQLKQQKALLAQKFQIKESVDIVTVLEALLLKHFVESKKAASEYAQFTQRFTDLSKSLSATSITDFKQDYEKQLMDQFFSGIDLVYNRDANSAVNPILDNRMQCYSGTTLFLALNERSLAPYKQKVVIFTSGHVLPGFIQLINGVPHLTGVESTASGKALVQFGETSKITGAIRVFDARQFLVMELYKDEITNFEHNYKIMQSTMEKYGFKPSELRALADGEHAGDALLNSTRFGFGSATVAAGDIERESFDIRDNHLYRAAEGSVEHGPGTILIENSEARKCFELLNEAPHTSPETKCVADDRLLYYGEYLQQLPDNYSYSYAYTVKSEKRADDGALLGKANRCGIDSFYYKTDVILFNLMDKSEYYPVSVVVKDKDLVARAKDFIRNSTDSSEVLTLQPENIQVIVNAAQAIREKDKIVDCQLTLKHQIVKSMQKEMVDISSGLRMELYCPNSGVKEITDIRATVNCIPTK